MKSPFLYCLVLLAAVLALPAWAVDIDLDGVSDVVDPEPNNILVTGYQPPWLYTSEIILPLDGAYKGGVLDFTQGIE